MDLAELLAASAPTSCEFKGKTINLEVYTGGPSCLTHEQFKEYRSAFEPYQPAIKRAQEIQSTIKSIESEEERAGELSTLRDELNSLDTGSVEISRIVVPFMLKSWSLNGEPMTWLGEPFPPTKENLMKIPNDMLSAVGDAAMEVWNPTTATDGQSTSEPEGTLDNSQIEATTNLPTSEGPQNGSAVTL